MLEMEMEFAEGMLWQVEHSLCSLYVEETS